jgi:hypothetical protein
MWNYWLGGKDHFAADRDAAQKVAEAVPSMPMLARAGRRFLIDAVHQLADGYRVRQFLDIGTGLPTAGNTHEVAQRAAPESRVVYVRTGPGIVPLSRWWGSGRGDAEAPSGLAGHCGIGRKP